MNYNHERGLNIDENIIIEPLTRISNAHIHSQRTAPSPRWSDVKGSNFSDKVYSLFTTRHSLKSAAFTLAEVLVTLGIIGVVSAMTVPTLMQNYQRQSYVTQLHKVYNETSQMLIQVMTDRNALNLNETGAFNNIENSAATFKKYFKVVHDCGATLTPCFASEYKSIDGTSTAAAGECWYAVSLANGASICFTSMINDGNYPYIVTYVDVNGAKGPNISGRDYFLLQFYNNGTIEDAGIESECVVDRICTQPIEQQRLRYGCTNSAWPASCLGRILNDNWQMTY